MAQIKIELIYDRDLRSLKTNAEGGDTLEYLGLLTQAQADITSISQPKKKKK